MTVAEINQIMRIKITDSMNEILQLILENGKMNRTALLRHLDIADRTIRYSLRRLIEADVLVSIPNLQDMREVYYDVRVDLK